MTIYKYSIRDALYNHPDGEDYWIHLKGVMAYKILSVQVQRDDICMWMLVSPGPEGFNDRIRVRIHGTGHEVGSAMKLPFIDTFQLDRFVFHVFAEIV